MVLFEKELDELFGRELPPEEMIKETEGKPVQAAVYFIAGSSINCSETADYERALGFYNSALGVTQKDPYFSKNPADKAKTETDIYLNMFRSHVGLGKHSDARSDLDKAKYSLNVLNGTDKELEEYVSQANDLISKGYEELKQLVGS